MSEPEADTSESRGQWHGPGPQPWPSSAMSFGCLFVFSYTRVCSWPLPFSLGDDSCFHTLKESLFPDDSRTVPAFLMGATGLCSTPTEHCQVGDQQTPWKSAALPLLRPLLESLTKILSSEAKITLKWCLWCSLSLKRNRRRPSEGDKETQ